MKYRVRVDMSFENEAEARSLMETAKTSAERASNISPGGQGGEISFCDLEQCRHDEGLPCTRLERVEISETGVSTL